MTRKIQFTIIGIALLLTLATACSGPSAREQDEKASEQILQQLQKSQPVPSFEWSQLRQNLIEIQTAQANTTATTSFFFNQGVTDPVLSCPSIGFPIPGTFQLTNPWQVTGNGAVISQVEPTGVFSGDTSATTVMCVNADGEIYASYWEGFVSTVTGAATWDTEAKTIKLTGDVTGDFSKGR